ncbi:glycoside hydrolase domain-containing protein [Clostridioides difficile]|uniref:glycoside hydrolase domain-containing protein n=1 Tax=Clostridioides difficile TaxID=1496 RepID=UPI002FE6976A
MHFEIVDNYLKELASLGEKVATVIVSDYPWAGQSCYKVYKIHQTYMNICLLYTSPNPRDQRGPRMPASS